MVFEYKDFELFYPKKMKKYFNSTVIKLTGFVIVPSFNDAAIEGSQKLLCDFASAGVIFETLL